MASQGFLRLTSLSSDRGFFSNTVDRLISTLWQTNQFSIKVKQEITLKKIYYKVQDEYREKLKKGAFLRITKNILFYFQSDKGLIVYYLMIG